MRLRGLPRELNCGNVELTPARGCRLAENFKTCSSCEFTDVKYFRLECDHIHCESCLVFVETQSDDLHVQCTVCNEVRSAREEKTALSTLLLARLECPCGVEGNLHFLSRHRRGCKQSRRTQSSDLDSSQASASSTSSMASSSSSSSCSAKKTQRLEEEIPKSVEFTLKGYLAHELMRMKEDIINTTRSEREDSEANMRRMMDRQDHLESRLNFLDSLDTRIETLESSADRTRLEPNIIARLDSIDSQVHGLRCGDYLREIVAQQFTRLHSRSVFMWFDVKSLLRDFNRTRTASATADQFMLIAGYPCKLHLQIDQDDGQKSLVLYLGSCEKLPYSANWPMRRQLTFRIFDTQGSAVFENTFSTTDVSCREYFKGPGSSSYGTYFGVDLCSTEELTVENFYQRNNGMICLGISVSPCGGTPAD